MSQPGKYTYDEIMSQPAVWERALQVFAAKHAKITEVGPASAFKQVIFTGCGSTHYLSMMAARLFEHVTGVPARAYPASELVLHPVRVVAPTLLVAISRSGTTTETLDAVDTFRQRESGQTMAITCHSESALAEKCDVTVAIDSARENSIAQTRSFTAMALVTQLFAATFAQTDTKPIAASPQYCQQLLNDYGEMAKNIGEDPSIERFFFLGGHTLYGIAAEAMLKMKEMSIAYSEVYYPLEFRHGPMSMVNESSLVIGLITPESTKHEIAVLKDMQARGAQILEISAGEASFEQHVSIPDGVPAWARPILYLPVLQLMAYYRALFNNQNPDKPNNLDAVVTIASLRDDSP